MVISAAFVLALFVASPALAANEEKPGADELYREAEEQEWYKSGNMRAIDALYDKAVEAGSGEALMMRANTRLYMERDDKKRKKLAGELCPKMTDVAKTWEAGGEITGDRAFHLARFHSNRWCPGRDVKKARELLLRAAELGNAKAQYYVGKMAKDKNSKEFFAWTEKAAKQDFPQAIANQGICYLLGLDVERDEKKGMELIDKALASKNSNAMYDIAIWYLEGDSGLPKNPEKAREILGELAAADFTPAKDALREMGKK